MRYTLAVLVMVLLGTMASAQQAGKAASSTLPPLAYVCTMPGDEAVLDDTPGKCPNCGMELVPIRLDSKWWCPVHQANEVSDGPGKCRRDGRDLVQVTLSEFWTCTDKPGEKMLEPGACTSGQPRKIGYEVRAHGDHNPKHGGQFFMGADQWHHVEGAYPSAGLFRVYFYDNFTKPMSAKEFSGSVVILDKANKEIASYPLALAAGGQTMEARIPATSAALPLNAAAKIKFGPKIAEQMFNFPFSAYSKDQAPAATTTSRTPAAAAPKSAAAPAQAAAQPPAKPTPPAPAPADQTPLILDSPLQVPPGLAEALDESKLPNATPGLLTELTARAKNVETLINNGELAQVWLPAMGTKTVALVLDARATSLPERQRTIVSSAASRIVTAAWEIDAAGDLGNREKITDAYGRLSAAVEELKAAYAQ
jgi:hypothetical protein